MEHSVYSASDYYQVVALPEPWDGKHGDGCYEQLSQFFCIHVKRD
jgi:hypothetical protein